MPQKRLFMYAGCLLILDQFMAVTLSKYLILPIKPLTYLSTDFGVADKRVIIDCSRSIYSGTRGPMLVFQWSLS